MLKLKIAPRLMLLFLAVSLLPFVVINLYWFRFSQSTLRNNATTQQELLTMTAASKVNQFITDQVNLLIVHSQTTSVQNFDLDKVQEDFSTLMSQDKDVESVILTDSAGNEKIITNKNGTLLPLVNIASSDAFRAATFLSGKEYISPVGWGTDGQPYIDIAIPLVKYNQAQILSNLSTAELGLIRDPGAIKGILQARVNLTNLSQTVLSTKIGATGYTYLVDNQGYLIAYPDKKFQSNHRDLSSNAQVAAFLKNTSPAGVASTVISEKGTVVISTYQPVTRTNWAVIAEEPVLSIFSTSRHVANIAVVIFIVVGLIVILVSYVFSSHITKPIKQLVKRAAAISRGDLQTSIVVTSNDELGVLAKSFNDMSSSLSHLIHHSRSESNKIKVILDNVSEGIIAIDDQRRIVVSNTAASALVGKLPKEIVGHMLEEVFDWIVDGESFMPPINAVKLYGGVSVVDPRERMHFLDVLVSVLYNDTNGIKAIITIIDKTEGLELENMKVDFVSMAAHELRTPMTAITGYIELIIDDPLSNLSDKTKIFLQRMKFSATQLVGLINNLLNVTKIERGTMTLNQDKMSLVEVAQRVVVDQTLSAKLKNTTLVYEGLAYEAFVLADQIAIHEVINNLVSNAIKYCANNGRIVISVERDKDSIITSVQDNGAGIPPNAVDHLFTKFYRVNSGLASGSSGTGLGLYICKSIVELHHGKIWVESKKDIGSTFTFTLPAFDQIQYDKVQQTRVGEVTKNRGWITKNIAR